MGEFTLQLDRHNYLGATHGELVFAGARGKTLPKTANFSHALTSAHNPTGVLASAPAFPQSSSAVLVSSHQITEFSCNVISGSNPEGSLGDDRRC